MFAHIHLKKSKALSQVRDTVGAFQLLSIAFLFLVCVGVWLDPSAGLKR